MTDAKQPHIALISMYYHPEVSGSAPYTTDIAHCFARAGQRVSVFTSWPHYPAWRVSKSVDGENAPAGVTVHRIRTYVPARPTLAKRLVYEILFSVQVFAKVVRLRDVDVVCGCSPNIFSAVVAAIAGKTRGIPVVQFVQDIVSAALIQTGQSRSSLAHRLLRRFERHALQCAEAVVVPTAAFRESVCRLGVDDDKVRVIRNWTRLEVTDRPVQPTRGLVLHTGNIGEKQALDLLAPQLEAASRADDRLHFVFVGDGNRRDELELSLKGIPAAQVVAPVPQGSYAALLKSASVLLVHERPGVLDMSLPSKLTSYFASGRPVLAVVEPSSLTAQEVAASGAGVVVDHGDTSGFLEALEVLQNDPALSQLLGDRGKRYVKKFLTPEAAFHELELVMKEVIGRHATRRG